MKSKSTAYLLWFFLGTLGAHKFYLDKGGMGVAYLFTLGFFGVGWFIDLFTLGDQVELYNMEFDRKYGYSRRPNPMMGYGMESDGRGRGRGKERMSAERKILNLSNDYESITLLDLLHSTNLSLDEAEATIDKLDSKGLIQKHEDDKGRVLIEFCS